MGSIQGNSQTQQPHSSKSLLDIPDTCADRAPVSSLLFDNSSKQSDPDVCNRKTFRVEPPSNLLSRLNDFLPQIAKANKELKAAVACDPSKVDIENVSPDSTQYIEMDLGLGVFDMKPKKDAAYNSDVVISARGNSDSDSSDEEEANVRQSRVVIDPSLIAGRQKTKPNIQVLNMDDDSSASCLSDSSSDSDQPMKL
ncbi:hypothetical protein COEREDRAFT_81456 [Coemansia reversa NRRL 1564]|uniref:Uncharacterized protein n=1 Tax=Coemansia reversa (strain ATCC 12441 / NRRL 1564) TaxID=763665 RepID=A0A2G5BB69_COERN|nr:hypothetical protein COEREDRAFT_81456 [Coemansia reversa NRRL 1564]|eukprot:PIA16258.1 hypothetical protein COEREDRAFT_81456 [Coemansia reversa NRRL 1564]